MKLTHWRPVLSTVGRAIARHWRPVLAALPLPMLALAASYGVYSFALLFVPPWVALAQAAAFELTYVGLAVVRSLDARQRGRASSISIGAVLASVIYNTLAGWFERQPQLLIDASPISWLFLAALHGAPLAWVAYLVADLLLHQDAHSQRALTPQNALPGPDHEPDHENTASEVIMIEREPARDRTCRYCGEGHLTAVEVMTHGRIYKATGSCGRAASAD